MGCVSGVRRGAGVGVSVGEGGGQGRGCRSGVVTKCSGGGWVRVECLSDGVEGVWIGVE